MLSFSFSPFPCIVQSLFAFISLERFCILSSQSSSFDVVLSFHMVLCNQSDKCQWLSGRQCGQRQRAADALLVQRPRGNHSRDLPERARPSAGARASDGRQLPRSPGGVTAATCAYLIVELNMLLIEELSSPYHFSFM
jgi:hypothetical protein